MKTNSNLNLNLNFKFQLNLNLHMNTPPAQPRRASTLVCICRAYVHMPEGDSRQTGCRLGWYAYAVPTCICPRVTLDPQMWEPVIFTLAVPKHDGKAARRSARQQHASANQRPRTQRRCESLAFYMLTPKLRQEIEQVVRAV